jgi:hypothetical protein
MAVNCLKHSKSRLKNNFLFNKKEVKTGIFIKFRQKMLTTPESQRLILKAPMAERTDLKE